MAVTFWDFLMVCPRSEIICNFVIKSSVLKDVHKMTLYVVNFVVLIVNLPDILTLFNIDKPDTNISLLKILRPEIFIDDNNDMLL